tara:strand:- start:1212 stop:2291 length:1080 start_codon:yes stop_codon:yes gene_type:complete
MTDRKYNFGAGPAAMPTEVLLEVQEELLDWNGMGISVMEISHRSPEFMEIAEQAESDFRDLLSIPKDYAVLFTHGGASLQNAMIPLNLSRKGNVQYVDSGYWASKSITEALNFCEVSIAASSKDKDYSYFPSQESWQIDETANYIHITPNETIGGIAIRSFKDTTIPLVADFSSSILSENLDVSKFGLIYGGAQKNIGPSGLGFVILNKDLIGHAMDGTPSMLDYQVINEGKSMFNTPPTFPWYVAGKVFKWLKSLGGISEISKINIRKANKLYDFIDNSDFYSNNIQKDSRSIMNVPFLLKKEELNDKFLQESKEAGLLALKGHRSVGGMRASIYNALPEEAIDSLIEFMSLFEKEAG